MEIYHIYSELYLCHSPVGNKPLLQPLFSLSQTAAWLLQDLWRIFIYFYFKPHIRPGEPPGWVPLCSLNRFLSLLHFIHRALLTAAVLLEEQWMVFSWKAFTGFSPFFCTYTVLKCNKATFKSDHPLCDILVNVKYSQCGSADRMQKNNDAG